MNQDTNWLKGSNDPQDYLYNNQQNDGGIDSTSTPIYTRIWSTAYAIPAASNKTWASILTSFPEPSYTTSNNGGQVPATTQILCESGDKYSYSPKSTNSGTIEYTSTTTISVIPVYTKITKHIILTKRIAYLKIKINQFATSPIQKVKEINNTDFTADIGAKSGLGSKLVCGGVRYYRHVITYFWENIFLLKINIIFMSRKSSLLIASALVVIGVACRLLPHLWNMTPMLAIALFSTTYLGFYYSFAISILIMGVSDFFIGFYDWRVMLAVYGSFILGALIGLFIQKNKTVATIFLSTCGASLIFFLVTNFAVWEFGTMYVHSFVGLTQSYVMGIPFFKDSLVGDLMYTGVFFGAFEAIRFFSLNKINRAIRV